jgi:hypothetical protein
LIRKKLSGYQKNIIKYFAERYGESVGLNKENVRDFMVESEIYSKSKYMQVISYIFGDDVSEVEWDGFFEVGEEEK